MRDHEPHPVAPDEHAFEAIDVPGLANARWRRSVGGEPESEDAVDRDRVIDSTRAASASGLSWGISYAAMYAHILRAQTATSRPRLRGIATHRATGARAALPSTAAGGSLIRRRSDGRATPAATRAQAVALIPLEARKRGQYMGGAATARGAHRRFRLRLDRMPPLCDPGPHASRCARTALSELARLGSIICAGRARQLHHPEVGGSPNANQIDSLYMIVLVHRGRRVRDRGGRARLLAVSFRAKKGAVAAQIHGNTRLEVGWTIARGADPRGADRGHVHQARRSSSTRRTRTGGWSCPPRPPNRRRPNGKRVTICVQGRQYIWRYTYGAGCNANYFTEQAAVLVPGDGTARRAPPSCS